MGKIQRKDLEIGQEEGRGLIGETEKGELAEEVGWVAVHSGGIRAGEPEMMTQC